MQIFNDTLFYCFISITEWPYVVIFAIFFHDKKTILNHSYYISYLIGLLKMIEKYIYIYMPSLFQVHIFNLTIVKASLCVFVYNKTLILLLFVLY